MRRKRGTYIISSQVGFKLSSKNFECSALPNSVGTNQTKNLAWARGRETMEFKRIGGVAVSNFRVEVGRKVNDGDGFEWTSEPRRQGVFTKMKQVLTS